MSTSPEGADAASLVRAPVADVLAQHLDDAALLYATRSLQAVAPHVRLRHLRRFDDRLAAHLDALSIAGDAAWPMIAATLENPTPSALFVAGVRAIETRNIEEIGRLFALVAAQPAAQSGLRAAFGWLESERLRGIVADLLKSNDALARCIAVAASALHRADPCLVTAGRLEDADPAVRARSLRAAGELGKRELVSRLAAASEQEEDSTCGFWAAWSAVLVGDREAALERLLAIAQAGGPRAHRASRLAWLAVPVSRGHERLRALSLDPANKRDLLRGTGLVGDPAYVPWLIGHMTDDKLARLAGESFSMITGLDLAALDLERKPPDNIEPGPNDDPEDANVALDEDDGSPWPDQTRIQRWWETNGQRFTQGERHFMGEKPSRAHCIRVLKEGFQRQRIAAAYHLCLLKPGTPLFEWRAPAWRQQRELARFVD